MSFSVGYDMQRADVNKDNGGESVWPKSRVMLVRGS